MYIFPCLSDILMYSCFKLTRNWRSVLQSVHSVVKNVWRMCKLFVIFIPYHTVFSQRYAHHQFVVHPLFKPSRNGNKASPTHPWWAEHGLGELLAQVTSDMKFRPWRNCLHDDMLPWGPMRKLYTKYQYDRCKTLRYHVEMSVFRQTDRQTDWQTDRDRQTDWQIDRQTDTHTHTQIAP